MNIDAEALRPSTLPWILRLHSGGAHRDVVVANQQGLEATLAVAGLRSVEVHSVAPMATPKEKLLPCEQAVRGVILSALTKAGYKPVDSYLRLDRGFFVLRILVRDQRSVPF